METLDDRIVKFIRRAPAIGTQAHLDKILATFPQERRAEILAVVLPYLTYLKPKEQ